MPEPGPTPPEKAGESGPNGRTPGRVLLRVLLTPTSATSPDSLPSVTLDFVDLRAISPCTSGPTMRSLGMAQRMKPKLGRNDPCPCGSGKKFKRCCLDAPAAVPVAPPSMPAHPIIGSIERCGFTLGAAEAVARGQQLPGIVVHPWVVARLQELTGLGPGGRAPRVSISSVRAMATSSILLELARAGVHLDPDAFVSSTADCASAWALSESWPLAPSGSPRFAGLAACELWRRLVPDRPCLEMLDERMQEGFDAASEGDHRRACEIWLRLCGDLLALLPEVDAFAALNEAVPTLCPIGNWMGDFQETLHNTALDDLDLARRGAELFERLVERFDDQPDLDRQLADFYFTLGDDERGVALLEGLIARRPDDAIGYACLSEHYGYPRRGHAPRDLPRAIEILEQALARPVTNPAEWDLHVRLDALRRR